MENRDKKVVHDKITARKAATERRMDRKTYKDVDMTDHGGIQRNIRDESIEKYIADELLTSEDVSRSLTDKEVDDLQKRYRYKTKYSKTSGQLKPEEQYLPENDKLYPRKPVRLFPKCFKIKDKCNMGTRNKFYQMPQNYQ